MTAVQSSTAAHLLHLAKDLISAGQKQRGFILLESLVDLYPDSEASREARELIRRQPRQDHRAMPLARDDQRTANCGNSDMGRTEGV